MGISRTTLAAGGRSLALLSLVLGIASLCRAGNITYNVNLKIGIGSATGTITTDGTIGPLNSNNIVAWNLLLNDGTTSFDVTTSNGEVFSVNPALSATATQLLFDFDVVSSDSFLSFANLTGPAGPYGTIVYELCFETSPSTCSQYDPAGAEAINLFGTSLTGIATFTSLSGTQVIGTTTLATLPSGSTCNGVYGGTFNGNVTVSTGQACTFLGGNITGNVHLNGGNLALAGVIVGGNVQIDGGGTFSIGPSATIDGNLQIQNIPAGTANNQVCGTFVKGNLEFNNNRTAVQIGSASPYSCAGNVIGGNLTVQNNTVPASAVGNTVGGNLTVQNNSAATTVDGNIVSGNLQDQNNTAPTQVFTNVVGNNLQCQSDSSITGGGNAAKSKQGQCSTF